MHRAVLRFDSTLQTSTLTVHQVRGFRQSLSDIDLLIFDVVLGSGLSRSEFLALRPDDISMEGIRIDESVIDGLVGRTKTLRRKDTAACPADVMVRLIVYAQERAKIGGDRCWLWPALKGDGPMDPDRWKEMLQKKAATLGITESVDWRMLRRTWSTISLKKNT